MAHIGEGRAALLARTKRIAGQVTAIERAIESDADCAKVLHLVAAVRGALNGLLDEIIVDHLAQHVAHADLTASQRKAGANDLVTIIRRYNR